MVGMKHLALASAARRGKRPSKGNLLSLTYLEPHGPFEGHIAHGKVMARELTSSPYIP